LVCKIVPPLLIALLAGCSEPPPRPSLVFVLAEALSGGDTGCGGSPTARTPHVDALARSGLQFRTCVTQSPHPVPALASLLTGRYPSGHGANLPGREIAPGVPMLAENIRSRSYRTAAFLAGDFPEKGVGLQNGFDVFDSGANGIAAFPDEGEGPGSSDVDVIEAALSWVRSDWKPCFLLVCPSGSAEEVDRAAGRLRRGLARHGTAAHTFWLFSALRGGREDDGPEARPLTRRELEVPMIVASPRWISAALRDDPAMLIDAVPTALQCLGFAPTRVPGHGLLHRAADGDGNGAGRTLVAEDAAAHAKAVRVGDRKAVHDETSGTWRVYDLTVDPAETSDVAATEPNVLRLLQQAMPESGMFDVPPPGEG